MVCSLTTPDFVRSVKIHDCHTRFLPLSVKDGGSFCWTSLSIYDFCRGHTLSHMTWRLTSYDHEPVYFEVLTKGLLHTELNPEFRGGNVHRSSSNLCRLLFKSTKQIALLTQPSLVLHL